jgi:hypothetical protein
VNASIDIVMSRVHVSQALLDHMIGVTSASPLALLSLANHTVLPEAVRGTVKD